MNASFGLRRVRATDGVYRSGGLWRVMQPGQEYLWPESAVTSLVIEGVLRGDEYFEGTKYKTFDVCTLAPKAYHKLCTAWRKVMATAPEAHLLRSPAATCVQAPPDSYEPAREKIWAGQPLDGKRVLLCGVYSIGDQLWYTHTLALLKKKFPRAVIYTLTYAGYGDGIWGGNADVNELQLPVTPAAFDAFDYYIPLSIVVNNINAAESAREGKVVHSARTPYEDFADMLGLLDMYDARTAQPRLYFTLADYRAMCVKITVRFFAAWGTASEPVMPHNHIVVQLHTQKRARDLSVAQLVNVLTDLRREYARSLIFLVGDGARGIEIYNGIAAKLNCENLKLVPIINGSTGTFSFRDIASLVAHAGLVVGPDSSFAHIAAAFAVPCVTVFGPYAATWRVTTYPYGAGISGAAPCALAPCAWPHAGFPAACPSRKAQECRVVTSTTGDAVIAAARGVIEKKRSRKASANWMQANVPAAATQAAASAQTPIQLRVVDNA